MTSTNQIYNTRRYYYVQCWPINPFTSKLLSQDPQLVLLLGPSSTVPPNSSFSGPSVVLSPWSPNSSLSFFSSYIPTTQRFFPRRSKWLRDSCKLLFPQGSPASVGVALPCSRQRRVSSSKITNEFIFSMVPPFLFFHYNRHVTIF